MNGETRGEQAHGESYTDPRGGLNDHLSAVVFLESCDQREVALKTASWTNSRRSDKPLTARW